MLGADAADAGTSGCHADRTANERCDNMNYMYSLNETGGATTSLIVDFDVKTDPNNDFISRRPGRPRPLRNFPPMLRTTGITVRKSVTAPLIVFAVHSPNGTHDTKFLANMHTSTWSTRSSARTGSQRPGVRRWAYAMRLWVKPDQLAKLGITVPEIINRPPAQNTVNPAGKIGGELLPRVRNSRVRARPGSPYQPEQFGQIVVRETP